MGDRGTDRLPERQRVADSEGIGDLRHQRLDALATIGGLIDIDSRSDFVVDVGSAKEHVECHIKGRPVSGLLDQCGCQRLANRLPFTEVDQAQCLGGVQHLGSGHRDAQLPQFGNE